MAGLGIPPQRLHAATGTFARAIGLVGMELAGQFVGTFEPADELSARLLARDADALGLWMRAPSRRTADRPARRSH